MSQLNWQIDIASLILGFVAGSLLILTLVLLWPRIRRVWFQTRSWFRAKNAWMRANSETRFRTEMSMTVQNRHLLGRKVSLDQIFVPPKLVTPELRLSSENGNQAGIEQLYLLWPEDASNVALEPPATISVKQLLLKGQRLIISGEAGTGKTSLLAYITSLCSSEEPPADYAFLANKLAVFLHISALGLAIEELIDLSDGEKAEPLWLVAYALASRINTLERNDVITLIKNQAIENDLMLIIDGWDEGGNGRFKWFPNWLQDLLSAYPDLQILVAGSVCGNGPLINQGFVEAKLLPWRSGQVQLLQSRLSKMREDVPEFSSDVFWEPGQSTILTILRLMSVLDNGDLRTRKAPLRRVEIFEGACRTLLSEITADGDDWLAPAAREFWQSIAFELVKSEAGLLTDDQLQLIIESVLRDYEAADLPRAQAKLRQTLDDSGLFVHYSSNTLGYLSPLWRDFLASSHISQTGAKLIIRNKLNDPAWKDIVQLYIGRAGAREMADMILQDDDPRFNEGLFQVANWLPETLENGGWRRQVLVRLGKQIMDSSLPVSWRQRAALALSETGEDGVSVLLNQLLREPNPALRQVAIGGMARVDPQFAIDPLQRMLDDSEQAVRSAAVHALAWIDEPATDQLVLKALIEPDEPVCRAAARSLALNGTEEDYEILREAITDESLSVRRAAVEGLSIVDTDWSNNLLRQVASDDQQRVIRTAAGIALQNSDANAEYDTWHNPLPGEQPWLVNWAVTHGRVVPVGPAAIPVLLEALRDSEAGIRYMAALTLGELGVKIARDPLRTALNDPDIEVRNAAFNALYNIDRMWSNDNEILHSDWKESVLE